MVQAPLAPPTAPLLKWQARSAGWHPEIIFYKSSEEATTRVVKERQISACFGKRCSKLYNKGVDISLANVSARILYLVSLKAMSGVDGPQGENSTLEQGSTPMLPNISTGGAG